jgi:hypothetical protein
MSRIAYSDGCRWKFPQQNAVKPSRYTSNPRQTLQNSAYRTQETRLFALSARLAATGVVNAVIATYEKRLYPDAGAARPT